MDGAGTHQSLRRAIAILRVFSESEPHLSVSEIARRLDLHKSTVSRILATLADEGIVWQNSGSGHYALGLGLVELAGVALGEIDVRAAAMPHIERLAAEVGETVTVSVVGGHEAVTVAHAASKHAVRHVSWIGRRIPLPTTAPGKVLLAAMIAVDPDTPILPTASSAPLVAGSELRSELGVVHRRGFATEVDEFESGGAGIAVPVQDAGGAVVAAVSVSGPVERFGADERLAAIAALRRTAAEIAFELGARREASA
ncbi:MAG: IclR family transcriptional regulator [Acidimicrobiia bacterium]